MTKRRKGRLLWKVKHPVFFWGTAVFFPEDTVEVAAVAIADRIDNIIRRQCCL